MGFTLLDKLIPGFSIVLRVGESPSKIQKSPLVVPPIILDPLDTSQEIQELSLDVLVSRRVGSGCGLTLRDLVMALGKILGLEQLGVGGHRGEAVDSVAGGQSSYTTGLGIGY